MADENFDPGERAAATQGLRGAYDGEGFGSSGGNDFDSSWLRDGYGYTGESKNFSLDNIFAGMSDKTGLGSNAVDLPPGFDIKGLLPGDYQTSRNGWGGPAFGSYTRDGKEGDLMADLKDVLGGGVTRYTARNYEDPLKWHEVFKNDEGKILGERDGRNGNSFFDKYGGMLAKMGASAIFSAGAGSLAGGLGGVGGAATKAALSSGFNGLMNGGDLGEIGKNFATNFLTGGAGAGNFGDFGEYTDLVNKVGRGAAVGALRGGGQGALIGAANPLVNKGLSNVSDYFSSFGNQWDQQGFGSGGMSVGAPASDSLQGIFGGMSQGGGQQGGMSTVAGMDNGSGGANNLDWGGILNGQQAFGNTNPQEGGGDMQPNAFGAGMDFGQAQGRPSFAIPAQAPTATNDFGDDFMKKYGGTLGGLGDGVKAALIASNPKYAALFGQQKMSPVGAGVGALASLYFNHRANSNLKDQAKGMKIGQDSSYMKAMREQLARKDAAGGRRSQYGPREVELQAKLAELNQRTAPYQYQNIQQQNMNNARTLQDLIGFGKQSGAFDAVGEGLKGLFS